MARALLGRYGSSGNLLLQRSPEFRELWGRPDVSAGLPVIVFGHREIGEVTVQAQVFDVRSAPGQVLLVYRAEPGSRDAEALRLLGSHAAATRTREFRSTGRPDGDDVPSEVWAGGTTG